jgi:hypothetical protein
MCALIGRVDKGAHVEKGGPTKERNYTMILPSRIHRHPLKHNHKDGTEQLLSERASERPSGGTNENVQTDSW